MPLYSSKIAYPSIRPHYSRPTLIKNSNFIWTTLCRQKQSYVSQTPHTCVLRGQHKGQGQPPESRAWQTDRILCQHPSSRARKSAPSDVLRQLILSSQVTHAYRFVEFHGHHTGTLFHINKHQATTSALFFIFSRPSPRSAPHSLNKTYQWINPGIHQQFSQVNLNSLLRRGSVAWAQNLLVFKRCENYESFIQW